MCLNHPEQVHNHPAHTEVPGVPTNTTLRHRHTPNRGASAPCTPCFPFNDVERKVSVRSNHPEHMCQNSPHLAISVMKWFAVLEPP